MDVFWGFFIILLVLGAKQLMFYKLFKNFESHSALIDHDRSSLYCFKPFEGSGSRNRKHCIPKRLDHQSSGNRWPLAMCQVARAALDKVSQSDFLEKEVSKCH